MTKKKFKGGDWTELSERWGIDTENLHDDLVQEETEKYMMAAIGDKKKRTKVVKDLREFLTKLVETSKQWGDYSQHVWQGLLNIPVDDDKDAGEETLIKFTCELLGCMWN